MITIAGRQRILRTLSGLGGSPIAAIAVGTGSTAATVNDTGLVYEIYRAPVTVASVDQVNGAVVYKAVIPETAAGVITELGAWSDFNTEDEAEPLLLTFEPSSETWSTGTYVATNAHVGEYALQVSGNTSLYGLEMDLSGILANDKLSLAFTASNTASIELRLQNNDTNYLSYKITNPAAGYQVVTFPRSAMTTVGVVDDTVIGTAQFVITAVSGQTATVQLDGLKISKTPSSDRVLVSRNVLVTPVVKKFDIPMEIEYTLDALA